MALKVGNE
jgi:hypothetical protein